MMSQKLPPFSIYFFVTFVLCIIGWGGLAVLIFMTVPTLAPRWLFFFLWFIALSGTSLPVMYLLNRRFPSDPVVEGGVVIREAMWVGVYGSIVAWLQMGKVLTSGLVVVLAVGLLMVEFLLRIGERSAWTPNRSGAAGEDDSEDEEDDDPYAIEDEEDE